MYITIHTEPLGSGTDAQVWEVVPINGKKTVFPLVAKVFFDYKKMKHEYAVMLELSSVREVNIPHVIGIKEVMLKTIKKSWLFSDKLVEEKAFGLVMEKIEGTDIRKLRGNRKIRREFSKQVDTCVTLGWYPGDANLMNGIYSTKKKKVYLIDFTGWIKYPLEDLEEMRQLGWFKS